MIRWTSLRREKINETLKRLLIEESLKNLQNKMDRDLDLSDVREIVADGVEIYRAKNIPNDST